MTESQITTAVVLVVVLVGTIDARTEEGRRYLGDLENAVEAEHRRDDGEEGYLVAYRLPGRSRSPPPATNPQY